MPVSGLGDEIASIADDGDLRAANRRLQVQLVRAKAKSEDLVAAVYQATRDSLVAVPLSATPKPRKDSRKRREEVALWHLTDWQGGKRTTSYDSAVMAHRVGVFLDKAESITAIQREDHPVRRCTILFGGDMVEGLFNFPTQAFEIDATIMDQWRNATRELIVVVRRALSIYEEVQVVSEWGNHGRIGSKRDAVPASDNIDRMAYETARMALEHEPRLHWEDGPEDIQKVEIGDYRALLLHGDETGRGGFVSQTTFLTYLNKLKAGAFGWSFQDAYTGHYHTHDERAMADGRGAWYQTGSTESDNRYARNGLGSRAEPSQRLHFIDPDKARVTAQYKVWLDD
jgi:hypothetical protein